PARRIERVGSPRGPARDRHVRRVAPSLSLGLRGVPGHEPGLPADLARGRIQCIHPALDTLVVPARVADEHQSLPDDRRRRNRLRVADARIGELGFPELPARAGVVGDDAAIARTPEQLAFGPGDAPVDLEEPARELLMDAPAHAAGGGIQGKGVLLGRSEECAADLDEPRLKPAFFAAIESAEHLQTLHAGRIDLAQRRMALGCQCVVVARPVALRGRRRLQAHGRGCQSETNQADAHNVHKRARTRTSRSHRGIQVSAPMIVGNTNASNAGLPARTWVATAPPRSAVIRTAPRMALRGIAYTIAQTSTRIPICGARLAGSPRRLKASMTWLSLNTLVMPSKSRNRMTSPLNRRAVQRRPGDSGRVWMDVLMGSPL